MSEVMHTDVDKNKTQRANETDEHEKFNCDG